MAFMKPFAEYDTWIIVDTDDGLTIYPSEMLTEVEIEWGLEITERIKGWCSRLSAPGYIDCTDWQGPYSSEYEALKELAESFDLCTTCWEKCWESEQGDCQEVE